MKFIIQSFSTTGVRPNNEDAMDYINNLDGSIPNSINILYSGIFDGHGGGDISKTLVDKSKINIAKYFLSNTSPIATKLSASKRFNEKYIHSLFIRIQEKLKNFYIKSNTMGSTALISLIYPKTQNTYALKVINLGDCRIVSCSNYNIGNQLSLDHKPNLLVERNRIEQMGGVLELEKGDDPRIGGMSVSKSFGDLDNKYISQIPDVFDYTLTDEKFIILACDGVWDVFINQDITDYVLERMKEFELKGKKIQEMKGRSENNIAQKVAEEAIKKGSQDNISIMIIFIQE